jgi:hypothetical protein
MTLRDRKSQPGMLARWWHNWKARNSAVGEIDCCGADETARIAQDAGLSVAELRTLAGRWPDSADLLERRMAAVGLSTGEIARSQPEVLRDLQRVCGQCAVERRCTRDLDRDERDRVWRDYCPNVVTLDALRVEERDRRLMRRRKWRGSGHTSPYC